MKQVKHLNVFIYYTKCKSARATFNTNKTKKYKENF